MDRYIVHPEYVLCILFKIDNANRIHFQCIKILKNIPCNQLQAGREESRLWI